MKQGIGNTGVPVAFPHSLGQEQNLLSEQSSHPIFDASGTMRQGNLFDFSTEFWTSPTSAWQGW
jgi:hypothetical protein